VEQAGQQWLIAQDILEADIKLGLDENKEHCTPCETPSVSPPLQVSLESVPLEQAGQ
jgi:hypothetical protein